MKPVEFAGQDTLLKPPLEAPRGTCGALPIRRVQTPTGPAMDSYWKPSAEELEQLRAGAHVCLTVFGSGHPPVWICVEKCEELP